MFRAIILHIFKSTRLCVTACGTMHPRCCLPVAGNIVGLLYVEWQKSNETNFLLTMNFILFTNQGYPLQNSSLGQLHSDGDIVSIVRSSAVSFLPVYLSARRLRCSGYYPKYQNDVISCGFLSRGNKIKPQGLRSGE